MKNIILKIHKKNIFRLQFVNYITVKFIIVFYIIFVSLSYGEEIFIGQGSRQLIYDQLAIQDAMKKFFGSKNVSGMSTSPHNSKAATKSIKIAI